MTRDSTTGAAGAPEASTQDRNPHGHVPGCSLLALAHHFEELLKTGAVETQAELAELAKLTPARVTQIMNLLGLVRDNQRRCRTLALSESDTSVE